MLNEDYVTVEIGKAKHFFLPQIVAMPVDDDVNAVLDSSIHHFRNTLNTEFGLVHIAVTLLS